METAVIDFSPIIQGLAGLLILALTALVTFGVNWVRGKIGLEKMQQDDIVRKYLEETIAHAVRYALAKFPAGFTVGKENAVTAEAVNYIINSVPDALAHFGITQESLIKMVESRLGSAAEAKKSIE